MATNNHNPNPRRTESQRRRILAYLQKGETLTPLQAFLMFGTSKLATRVSELILEEGHTEIEKRWVTVANFDGEDTRVMQYFIPKEKLEK